MKYIKYTSFILGLLLIGCYQNESKTTSVVDDKEQIQNLIRQVLNWGESKNSIDLLPLLTNNKDSICIGFDLDKLKLNLDKLRKTNFFGEEFIENYNHIILTLDKKIKSNEFGKWNTNELPAFGFANDINPWCVCQDVPYDKPNPWNLVLIKVITLDNEKGELTWTWGSDNTTSFANSEWSKDFGYKFRVIKENEKWKISYLQGFDYEEGTRKVGL